MKISVDLRVTHQKHLYWIAALSFSSNGDLLASGSVDMTACVWDVNANEFKYQLRGPAHNHHPQHGGTISAAFSPDGKLTATAECTLDDSVVKLWRNDIEIPNFQQKEKGWIVNLAFSPDSKLLASAILGKGISIINARSAEKIHSLDCEFRWCAFSPNWGIVATHNGMGSDLIIWNVFESQPIKQIQLPKEQSVSALSFSPDGKRIALAVDFIVQVFNVNTGHETFYLLDNTNYVTSLAFTHDALILAVGCRDGKIHFYNMNDGNHIGELVEDGGVNELAFSPRSHILAVGRDGPRGNGAFPSGLVQLYDLEVTDIPHQDENIPTSQLSYGGHMEYSPWLKEIIDMLRHGEQHFNGSSEFDKRIALISFDNALETTINTFLNLKPEQRNGQTYRKDEVERWLVSYNSKLDFIESYAARMARSLAVPKSDILWYHGIRNELYHSPKGMAPDPQHINGLREAALNILDILFNVDLRSNLANLAAEEYEYPILASTNLVKATSRSGNPLPTHPAKTFKLVALDSFDVDQLDDMLHLAFSTDGRSLAMAGNSSKIYLWDIVTHTCFRQFDGHTTGVTSVAFSPNGHILASGTDKLVRIWNIISGELVTKLAIPGEIAASLAFSHDGSMLYGGGRHALFVWYTKDWKSSKVSLEQDKYLAVISPSPQGRYIAIAGQKLWIYDMKNGRLREILGSLVSAATFSTSGNLLLSVDGQKKGLIRLWDTRTFREVQRVPGHIEGTESVAISPDETLLVSGGRDNTIIFRDLWDGSEVARLENLWQRITAVGFSRDQRLFLAADSQSSVKIWAIEPQE